MIDKLLFPPRCPICDAVKKEGTLYCKECEKVPRRVSGARCFKCSKHVDNDEEYCYDCKTRSKAFISGIALYEYDSVKESIESFKNEGRSEYGATYARAIYKDLYEIINSYNAQALVPIPIHKSKYRRRGYNQAKVLADELSKLLKIPVRDDILIKVKNTKDQKKQSALERQNNMLGTFQLAQNDVKLKTIILVDDVYTTGATIDEATRTLLSGGVERVFFVTLAIGIGKS